MISKLPSKFITSWLRRGIILVTLAIIVFFAVRIFESLRGPRLELWHTFVPHEMEAKAIDVAGWTSYVAAENRLFDEVKTNVSQRLEADQKNPLNRYFEGSIIYPDRFEHNWNHSYIMKPDGKPIGAVVLLHGLTDTPYSLRHVADLYRKRGFVVVAIRLPAHGTVPSALSKVHWEDWLAATRLAVREAKHLSSREAPLHLVGFSNGGALAMKYTLDALDDPELSRPQQVILISPMIGVTSFARFAGIAGLPAIFPPFANAAWLSITPEFNPFKYNSFPVNGARQSYLLTSELQKQIYHDSSNKKLAELPPILTFQSVVDFTVSTEAIITALYNLLPANGSELVLFDINRSTKVEQLFRPSTISTIDKLLPRPPRLYQATMITNATEKDKSVVARSINAGARNESVESLGLDYPPELFSLSHVALPFPVSDPLYGSRPENPTQYGINLGDLTVRGERLVLIVDLDTLLRVSSNPFFPYMLKRIDADIPKTPMGENTARK
jgi:alpha-beta hydrolase superfamily lysophospholipase